MVVEVLVMKKDIFDIGLDEGVIYILQRGMDLLQERNEQLEKENKELREKLKESGHELV